MRKTSNLERKRTGDGAAAAEGRLTGRVTGYNTESAKHDNRTPCLSQLHTASRTLRHGELWAHCLLKQRVLSLVVINRFRPYRIRSVTPVKVSPDLLWRTGVALSIVMVVNLTGRYGSVDWEFLEDCLKYFCKEKS